MALDLTLSLYHLVSPPLVLFIDFTGLEDNQFLEEFCDTLKKYRITAKDADFYSLKNFKPEQYVTLFKVLKPVRAELVSRGSNLFEVLLEVKELVSSLLFFKGTFLFSGTSSGYSESVRCC